MKNLAAIAAALAFCASASAQDASELEERIATLEALVAELSANNPTTVFNGIRSGGPNLLTHGQHNSIDPDVHTATIAGGGSYGRENRVGSGPEYRPGTASHAVIGGGYDNINNQLAGTAAGGAHHYLSGDGDHGTVGGGSLHVIQSGSYGTIGGGTQNMVDGTKATVSGGGPNSAMNHYTTVAGGSNNVVEGYAGMILGGRYNQVNGAGQYGSVVSGRNNVVTGMYAVAAGRHVVAAVPGGLSISGRRNSEAGDAQGMLFNLSATTFDGIPKHLNATGNWTSPVLPSSTAWAGSAHVIAKAADGRVSAWRLPFVVTRIGGARTVAVGNNADKELLVDGIGLNGNELKLELDSSSAYFRLKVQGLPATNIDWSAVVVATQVR